MKLRTTAPRTSALLTSLVAAVTLTACGAGQVETPQSPDDEAGGTSGAAGGDCPVGEPDESVDTTVRIAYQDIPNGDLLVKQEGLLEACLPSATIQWNKFDSGGSVVQAFGSGSADIGLAGSSPAVKAMSEPLNLDVQAIYIYDVIGDAESLVVKDESITGVEGLRGKKVAVPFSSTAHFSLLKILQDEGLESEVELINLSPDAMVAAFDRDEIDGAWVWAPTLPELVNSGGTPILSNADAAERGFATFDMAIGSTPFVEDNPEFMEMWTRVQDHASTQINENPEEAAASIAAALGLEPDAVQDQFPGYEYPDAAAQAGEEYFGGRMGQVLAETATFLADVGEVDSAESVDFYTERVYSQALETVAQE